MTIEYTAVREFAQYSGSYDGDEAAIIAAAVEFLAAAEEEGEYRYHADEAEADFLVSRQGMLEAGAAILAGEDDWYSLWCTSFGDEVPTRA